MCREPNRACSSGLPTGTWPGAFPWRDQTDGHAGRHHGDGKEHPPASYRLLCQQEKKMSCFQDLTCPFFQKEFIPPGFHDRFKSLGSPSSVVYQETSSSVFSS